MSGLWALIFFRAKLLALALLIALALGERLSALTRLDRIATTYHRFAAVLGARLNRPSRSISTRVYRGIIALMILEIPALGLAISFHHGNAVWELIGILVMIALLGRGFGTHTLYTRWNQAKAGALPLEVDDTLFNDVHGVLRHIIAQSAEHFSVRIIGGGFWFVIGGLPGMFAYLALALAAFHYTGEHTRAFGWAALRLFRIVHAMPQCIGSLVLVMAGLLTPQTYPLTAIRHGIWQPNQPTSLVAIVLGITLGGTSRNAAGEAEMPWVGSGTAQLTVKHLTSWLMLMSVATFLVLLGLLALTAI